MNLEGQGHGFLTPSRSFLVEEPKSSYAFNSYWCSEPHKINFYQCYSVTDKITTTCYDIHTTVKASECCQF